MPEELTTARSPVTEVVKQSLVGIKATAIELK
jgi:hypothetical protein